MACPVCDAQRFLRGKRFVLAKVDGESFCKRALRAAGVSFAEEDSNALSLRARGPINFSTPISCQVEHDAVECRAVLRFKGGGGWTERALLRVNDDPDGSVTRDFQRLDHIMPRLFADGLRVRFKGRNRSTLVLESDGHVWRFKQKPIPSH